jgi:hypothetical protein
MHLMGPATVVTDSSAYGWSEVVVLGSFLLAYGFLLLGVFILFWRWAGLVSYQGLVTTLRQGRGVFWQRLTLFLFVCFTGLPPVFFFFAKLGLLVYVMQFATLVKGLLILFFLLLGWYVYFTAVRWFTLTQVVIGYSKALTGGLYSARVVLVWVFFFFLAGGLIFLLDDFFVLVSWLFS